MIPFIIVVVGVSTILALLVGLLLGVIGSSKYRVRELAYSMRGDDTSVMRRYHDAHKREIDRMKREHEEKLRKLEEKAVAYQDHLEKK